MGTDIQDNKCSWLVVQALSRATPAQRKVLETHYGKHEESSVRAHTHTHPHTHTHIHTHPDTHTLSTPHPHPHTDTHTKQVAAVKALYKEMGLEGVFKQYEEESYKAICAELDALPRSIPRPVFEILLKKIYKRSK